MIILGVTGAAVLNGRMLMLGNAAHLSGHRLGILLVTASAVAWSTAGLFTRIISLDVATMLVWRGIFGAIGILAVAFALQGRGVLYDFKKMGWPGWAFASVSAFGMLCFITSLRLTTVAHVSIIYATVPFVAAALAWMVIGERPSRSAITASLVSLIGVAIIVGLGSEGQLSGNLLAFGMTFSLAIMMVIARKHDTIPTLPAACVSALISAAVAVPLSDNIGVSGHDLGLLALFGVVNSAVGLALFTIGSRFLPPIETALIGALDAPLAPIWVWLFFAEMPSIATLTGGAIVFCAVLAHVVLQHRR
ncbi:MAG: DMT family transporter [Roseobacter sp.]